MHSRPSVSAGTWGRSQMAFTAIPSVAGLSFIIPADPDGPAAGSQ